jgi:hypothetical protein
MQQWELQLGFGKNIWLFGFDFSLFVCLLLARQLPSVQWTHLRGFLDDTQRRTTVGRTPLDEWADRRTDLYLTTHDTNNRQTSMPPVGFETTISANERPLGPAVSISVGVGMIPCLQLKSSVRSFRLSEGYRRCAPIDRAIWPRNLPLMLVQEEKFLPTYVT